MLRKLMKYEFRALARILLPLYLALMAAAVFLSYVLYHNYYLDSGKVIAATEFLHFSRSQGTLTVSWLIYGFAMFMLFIVTLIMVVQRFNKNIYGDEGYLTLALPVKLSTHITNKVMSAAVWAGLSAIAGIISMVIVAAGIAGPAELMEFIEETWRSLTSSLGTGGSVLLIVEVLLLIMVCTASFASKIYASIAIAKNWTYKHSILCAVIIFLVLSVIQSLIVSCINLDDATLKSLMLNLYYYLGNMSVHTVILIAGLFELAWTLIYWFIAWRTMEHKISLS